MRDPELAGAPLLAPQVCVGELGGQRNPQPALLVTAGGYKPLECQPLCFVRITLHATLADRLRHAVISIRTYVTD